MEEDTLRHALEPFFTTKGVGKGTGLGLPMVLGLAEQSGGKLILKSRRGEGTVAELWLPVAHASAPSENLDSANTAQATARPLVVMAVDDDALVLMNTVEMLEELGHKVLQASCAQQALEAIQQCPSIDLLITDQAMPQMTGVQLAEVVSRDRPTLPVILATGYGELPASASRKILKLAKPFSEKDLARTIDLALRDKDRSI